MGVMRGITLTFLLVSFGGALAGCESMENFQFWDTKTKLAGYKCPKAIEFRETLARTATGKLQKFKLRQTYWEGRDKLVN